MAIEAKALRFLQGIEQAYSTRQVYRPADHQQLREFPPSLIFAGQKRETVKNLLYASGEVKSDAAKSVLSEWAAYQTISSTLDGTGFAVELAPPGLETGEKGRRGIDIVISTQPDRDAATPLLGINVKLQAIKPEDRLEKHRFDPAICGPAINVSLGDWRVDTKNQEELDIRSWINTRAVKNIIKSGQLPYFNLLRGYIFDRISVTLNAYVWKTDHYMSGNYIPNDHEAHLFPANSQDFDSFNEKLRITQTLFTEVLLNT